MNDSTKDYIINLRVSKDTYEKIKERSCKNRETISNLVRTIINDSIDTANDLSSELLGSKKKKADENVVSYQRGVMAQDKKCDDCDCDMKNGDTIIIGETATNARRYFCKTCKPNV